MIDLTSIATLVTSIKTATELAKIIKDSGISIEQAETKLKLAELISALADAKIEIANIQTLILEKEETIKELKRKQNLKENLKFEAPYYWLISADEKQGPFCQCCFDNNEKVIRLIEKPCLKGNFTCHVCNTWYGEGHFDGF